MNSDHDMAFDTITTTDNRIRTEKATVIKRPNPFTVSSKETIGVLLLLPLTFLYVSMAFTLDYVGYYFGAFTLGYLALGEYMYHDVKRTKESWLFMLLTLLCSVAVTFDLGQVWQSYEGWFTHLFAVYWLLCRSGKLYKQQTSHLFLLDGINGFLLTPFGNYPLIFQTLLASISRKNAQEKEKKDSLQILSIILASVLGIALFAMAMKLLISADINFKRLMKLPSLEWFAFSDDLVAKLLITVIIAPYLYGLFGGSFRKPVEKLQQSAQQVENTLAGLKRIPGRLWLVFIALFSIFYIIFFLLQGSYMISALQMILPESYTFSGYARRGFAEMIGITFVNYMLLWLSTRTAEQESKVKTGGIILIAETIVFILIASLKIFMYIQAYGWTPLRAQSIWLCAVLFFTCGCILYRLITGKDVARFWFLTSATSLGVLTIF